MLSLKNKCVFIKNVRNLYTPIQTYLKSFMYVPASNKHFLEKCLKKNSDAIIIDLEDSILDGYKVFFKLYII